MSSKNKKNTVSDKKERRRNRWLVTELIAIFAAICVIFFWGSGVWKDFFPAIRINGSGYRLADFNYFYYAYYNSFVQENSNMVSYMFDEGKSLKEQTYDNKTAFHADILMNLNYLWNNLWTNIGIFSILV